MLPVILRSSGVQVVQEEVGLVFATRQNLFTAYFIFFCYISNMNRPAQSFRDLIVWQRAREFMLRTYELTKHFPRDEQYCLIPQIRRAAISIPALEETSRLLVGYAKAVTRNNSKIIRTDFD